MAHYAFLDENDFVIEVITGKDENEGDINWEEYYGQKRGLKCKRTSYNGNIRGIFAGYGFHYNQELDRFVPPFNPLHPLYSETTEDPTQDYPLCRFRNIITNKIIEERLTLETFERMLESSPHLEKIEIIPVLKKTIEEDSAIDVNSWIHQVS